MKGLLLRFQKIIEIGPLESNLRAFKVVQLTPPCHNLCSISMIFMLSEEALLNGTITHTHFERSNISLWAIWYLAEIGTKNDI